ncbi:hypothetical protein RQM41_24315 [Citrobacter koseri]|uniref:hypothetical protein n=1 Tax=Citrobacter koseri TaxID=545 RepID=UPI0028C2FB3F|nr:hypothetical protein [Citrobacter koseri]
MQHTNWQKLVQMLPISRKWKGLTTPQKANPVRLILSDSLSVSLKIPQFPSISDIIDKVKDEVCNTVKSKINEKWGSLTNTTLDPWSTISSRLPDTSGILPNASSKNVQLNNPAAASGSGEDANSDAFPFHL